MSGRLWAAKDERALKKLYPIKQRGEITWTQLKRALGRSRHSINSKASQLGLTGKVQSTLDMAYFEELKRKYIRRGH